MKIGHFTDKAPRPLVIFVIGCCFITTGLLWSIQKAVERGGEYYSDSIFFTYL